MLGIQGNLGDYAHGQQYQDIVDQLFQAAASAGSSGVTPAGILLYAHVCVTCAYSDNRVHCCVDARHCDGS
jgi:hypothetical protein